MLQVASLGSGSCGNALLVWDGVAALLVDCGLSLRAVERCLAYLGCAPERLSGVLLTHEHGDHTLGALPLARRYKLPLICNGPTRAALGEAANGVYFEELSAGRAAIGPFEVSSFALPHDAAAPVGYRIATHEAALAVAVDLGSWNEVVVAGLADADLLVVEANHDREMLMAAPYPWPVQQRIFGPLGHLDNMQAGELLARVASDGRTRTVWLAHLSEHANSPQRAVAGVQRVLTLSGTRGLRLTALPRRARLAPGGMPIWTAEALMRQQPLF